MKLSLKLALQNLSLFLLLIYSCNSNQVFVKFKNDSSENFKQLHVNIFGEEFEFNNLRLAENLSAKITLSKCSVKFFIIFGFRRAGRCWITSYP
jgi:hypothetical protein